MIQNSSSQQKWLAQIQNTTNKQTANIKQIYAKIISTKNKWIQNFQQSIQLWIDFMLLKTQTIVKDLQRNYNQNQKENENENKNERGQSLSREVISFIKETQQSVLQGLKNIYKLYMIPQLKIKSYSKDSKQIYIKPKSKSKSIQRNKSSSLTLLNSNFSFKSQKRGKNGKSDLFNFSVGPLKTNKMPLTTQNFLKTNSYSQNNNMDRFMKANYSQITKAHKNKIKNYTNNNNINQINLWNTKTNSKSNFTQNLPLETKQSYFYAQQQVKDINSNIVNSNQNQSIKSVFTYFKNKEINKENQIIEKVTHRFEQKIKYISSDLNNKLDEIIKNIKQNKNIQNINQNKQIKTGNQHQSKYRNEKIKTQQFNQMKQQYHNSQNKLKTQHKIPSMNIIYQNLKQNQVIKRNNMIKNITKNQIMESENENENTNSQELLKIKQKMEKFERNIQQFQNLTGKVKLDQINKTLTKIFIHSYIYECKKHNYKPKLQRLNTSKIQNLLQKQKIRQQYKGVMIKFKKLLKMDKIKDKLQITKMYMNRVIECGNDLIICNSCPVAGEQTALRIDKIIQML